MQKILRIIGESPFGIHDISRVEPDRSSNLPRFNMPLELGLFLGAKAFGVSAQQAKRCVVLDEEPYRYQKYCSDIAGQDIRAHGGKPQAAIEIVRNWLSTTPAAQGTVIPSGSVIAKRYKMYRAALPSWCEKLQLNPRRLTFGDDVTLVVAWLQENPWAPAPEQAPSLSHAGTRSSQVDSPIHDRREKYDAIARGREST
ncbi:MAG TPA: hypothetical protein VNA69_00610 [Thermoanaerobaculia bacterium]|nr:hypothetical protein [Thermoanaerobaculia bacterium]